MYLSRFCFFVCFFLVFSTIEIFFEMITEGPLQRNELQFCIVVLLLLFLKIDKYSSKTQERKTPSGRVYPQITTIQRPCPSGRIYPQITTIQEFVLQIRSHFPIFEKGLERPPPFSPLVTRLLVYLGCLVAIDGLPGFFDLVLIIHGRVEVSHLFRKPQ